MTIIQYAVWLYHRFPLSDRDVQEVLHQRGRATRHGQPLVKDVCLL